MRRIVLSGCTIIENNMLLVLWKLNQQHYEFPGGKVEAGESLKKAAIRETLEEIGCKVTLIRYLGACDFRISEQDFTSHKYLACIPAGQTPRVMEPEKHKEIFWLPIHDFRKYSLAPNVRVFCEQYQPSQYL